MVLPPRSVGLGDENPDANNSAEINPAGVPAINAPLVNAFYCLYAREIR